jgi:hypothetical protein
MRTAAGSIFLALAAIAVPCWASPLIHLQWSACPASTWQENRNFTGPGNYRQVIVGSGFDQRITGYTLKIRGLAANVYDGATDPPPNAWRFDPAGCQAGHLQASVSSATCPTLGGTSPSVTTSSSLDQNTLYVTVEVRFPAVQPNPSTTYDILALDFDHLNSLIGPQGPSGCGGADERMCFTIWEAHWFDQFSESHAFYFELFSGVSWQDPRGTCFGDLPVTPLPWSRIKALYH